MNVQDRKEWLIEGILGMDGCEEREWLEGCDNAGLERLHKHLLLEQGFNE